MSNVYEPQGRPVSIKHKVMMSAALRPQLADIVRMLISHTALRIVRESQPDRRNFYLNRDYLVVLQKPVVTIRRTDCDAFDARNTQ
jgi:hypothetical protein